MCGRSGPSPSASRTGSAGAIPKSRWPAFRHAYELITVVLTDLGDGRTEMFFRQSGRLPAEVYEGAKEGWGSFFDRIAERLAGATD
jgi:hypothetical protein